MLQEKRLQKVKVTKETDMQHDRFMVMAPENAVTEDEISFFKDKLMKIRNRIWIQKEKIKKLRNTSYRLIEKIKNKKNQRIIHQKIIIKLYVELKLKNAELKKVNAEIMKLEGKSKASKRLVQKKENQN